MIVIAEVCGKRKRTSCDALRDLVPFLRFKKRENHPWRSVTFSNVAGVLLLVKAATLLKVTLLHGCFSGFLNRKNGIKSRNAPQLIL